MTSTFRLGGAEDPPPYSNVARSLQYPTQNHGQHQDSTAQLQWISTLSAYPKQDSVSRGQSLYHSAIQSVVSSTAKPGLPVSTNAEPPKAPLHRRGSSIACMGSENKPNTQIQQQLAPHPEQPRHEQANSAALPPAFNRQPRLSTAPAPFKPLYLLSRNTRLDSGFPRLRPVMLEQAEHPFGNRDIEDHEWFSFLAGLQAACVNGVDPSLNPSALAARQIQLAAGVIDFWNKRFFCPRCLKIYLTQGPRILAGSSTSQSAREAPDWATLLLHVRANVSMRGRESHVYESFRLTIVPL